MHKTLILFLIFAFLLESCEKEIKLDINTQTPKLVVDASIENDSPPVVVLSRSLNYFNTITPEEASESFIHNAMVTISDGTKTAMLDEYEFYDSIGNKFYYYSINPFVADKTIYGKLNTTYNLKIEIDSNEQYLATTTIPSLTKTCDSLYWQPAPNNPDTTRCVLFGIFSDPPGLGNYVRYFTSTNKENFYPGYNSVFDDQVVEGKTYNAQIPRGFNRLDTTKVNSDDFGYFHKGDTATLKFCNIDKATYTFWNTWEFSEQSIGNPFSSPNKVIGNINNGALGNFSGYAAQFKTLIIPK